MRTKRGRQRRKVMGEAMMPISFVFAGSSHGPGKSSWDQLSCEVYVPSGSSSLSKMFAVLALADVIPALINCAAKTVAVRSMMVITTVCWR